MAEIADEGIVGAQVNGMWSLVHWAMDWAGTSGDATMLVELHDPITRVVRISREEARTVNVTEFPR